MHRPRAIHSRSVITKRKSSSSFGYWTWFQKTLNWIKFSAAWTPVDLIWYHFALGHKAWLSSELRDHYSFLISRFLGTYGMSCKEKQRHWSQRRELRAEAQLLCWSPWHSGVRERMATILPQTLSLSGLRGCAANREGFTHLSLPFLKSTPDESKH